MSYRDDPWKRFRYELELFERDLKALNYVGAFEAHEPAGGRFDRLFSDFFPSSGITPENVTSLLSARFVGPPHGFDLLQPVPLPDVPKISQRARRNAQTNTTHGLLKRRRSLSANF